MLSVQNYSQKSRCHGTNYKFKTFCIFLLAMAVIEVKQGRIMTILSRLINIF